MTRKEMAEESDRVFAWLERVPDIPQGVRGVEFTAPCSCGGMIRARRSKENGHLRARCDSCRMRLIE